MSSLPAAGRNLVLADELRRDREALQVVWAQRVVPVGGREVLVGRAPDSIVKIGPSRISNRAAHGCVSPGISSSPSSIAMIVERSRPETRANPTGSWVSPNAG